MLVKYQHEYTLESIFCYDKIQLTEISMGSGGS